MIPVVFFVSSVFSPSFSPFGLIYVNNLCILFRIFLHSPIFACTMWRTLFKSTHSVLTTRAEIVESHTVHGGGRGDRVATEHGWGVSVHDKLAPERNKPVSSEPGVPPGERGFGAHRCKQRSKRFLWGRLVTSKGRRGCEGGSRSCPRLPPALPL